MTEQKLQSAIIAYLQAKGCYVVKTMVTSRAGVPDLLVCMPGGKFLAIEVKGPKGKPSTLQLENLKQIRKLGGTAKVVYSLNEVKAILEFVV